jgi:hypothetical protein
LRGRHLRAGRNLLVHWCSHIWARLGSLCGETPRVLSSRSERGSRGAVWPRV